MTRHITLKTKDICDALNIRRHQMRSWVEQLAPYSHRKKRERSACKYDSADLLFFAVVNDITDKFHLPLNFIATFSESLHICLREPRDSTVNAYLFINGKSCTRITLDSVSEEGILVDLQPALLLVNQFFGLSTPPDQLQLGLTRAS